MCARIMDYYLVIVSAILSRNIRINGLLKPQKKYKFYTSR